MVQTENIIRHKIASVESPVFAGLNNHCLRSHPDLDRGFLHIFSPLDYIEAIQRGGQLITCSEISRLYPLTDNLGLADSIGADVKNRNIITANRYS
jgi:hypothetical protein